MTAVGYDIWFLAFTGVVTVANLLLIPFVIKENKRAFLGAMIGELIIFLVILTVGPVYTLVTTSWQSTMDYLTAVVAGIVWLILQIPVIFFSFRAYRKI